MKRKALGRGLSALIPGPSSDEPSDSSQPGSSRDYFICPIERLRPGENQPRRFFDEERLGELVESIKAQGIIQPLVVRSDVDGDFVLVAGERRWRAAQRAGLHEVPVVIREVSDVQAIEMALVENIQREDLNPVEEAEALARLIEEHGYTQERLASRLGRERSTVTNTLRLTRLPAQAREALISGVISAGHARALLGLDEEADLLRALAAVVKRSLSVRQTEALVRRLKSTEEPPAPPAPLSANARDLQERLSHSLKTRVRLHMGKKDTGRIEITYSSLDELDRILDILLVEQSAG